MASAVVPLREGKEKVSRPQKASSSAGHVGGPEETINPREAPECRVFFGPSWGFPESWILISERTARSRSNNTGFRWSDQSHESALFSGHHQMGNLTFSFSFWANLSLDYSLLLFHPPHQHLSPPSRSSGKRMANVNQGKHTSKK